MSLFKAQTSTPMRLRELPQNIWAVSLTSFLMDISSEMVLNLIPLFLANVLGAGGTVIGAVEGVAESVAALLRIFSGYLSDRLRRRKWLAVLGYGISALSKPFFLPGRGVVARGLGPLGRPGGKGDPHRAPRCLGRGLH